MMNHGCDHAVEAAAHRYGVQLAAEDFAAMVHDIITTIAEALPMACLLSRQVCGREIWLVRVPEGPVVRAVYDPRICMIVTVLPRDYRRREPE